MERDKQLYYKDGYKYLVTRPYSIKLDIIPFKVICLSFKTCDISGNCVEASLVTMTIDGKTTVFPGYAWDGASGPTIDTLSSMIASLIHDVIYQFIRLGLIDEKYKEYADQCLHDLCTEDGMMELRADIWKFAVDCFGKGSILPSAEHSELVAP